MSNKIALHVAAFILTIAASFHFLRAVLGWEIVIEDWSVPAWVSILLFAVAGVLAFKLWKLAK